MKMQGHPKLQTILYQYKRDTSLKVTQIPTLHAANMVANIGDTTPGVESTEYLGNICYYNLIKVL